MVKDSMDLLELLRKRGVNQGNRILTVHVWEQVKLLRKSQNHRRYWSRKHQEHRS